MRFVLACSLALLLLSASPASSRTIGLGPVTVEADMNRNENCTLGVDEELCAAFVDSNGTSDPGDDEIWHDKSVDEAAVRVSGSPSNESQNVTLRPDDLFLAHPTFSLANQTWSTLSAAASPLEQHATLDSSALEDRPGDQIDASTWGLSVNAHPVGTTDTRIWVLCWDIACGRVWWGAFESEEDGIRFTSFLGSASPWDSDPWMEGLLEGASTCYLSVWRDVECPEAVLSLVGQHGGVAVTATTDATPEVHAFSHVNGTSVHIEEKTASPTHRQQTAAPLARSPSKSLPTAAEDRKRTPDPLPALGDGADVPGPPGARPTAPAPPPSPPSAFSTAQAKPVERPVSMALVAGIATSVALALVLAAFYTRLSRDRVLEHKTRKTVYDAVCQQPGIRVGTIAARLGLDHKAVQHHVGILQDFSLVKTSGPANNRLLPVGQLSSSDESLCTGVLASPTARSVYDLLVSNGPLDLKSIASALDLTYSTASATGVRLRKAGLVRRERRWRQWVLRPILSPEARVGVSGSAPQGTRQGVMAE